MIEAGETDESRDGAILPRLEPKTGATSLRQLFRQVFKAITEPAPPPPKKRRRRTEETRGAFTMAATSIIRWMKQLKPPPTLRTRKPPRDDHPFDELHSPELWQWNDHDAGYETFGDFSATAQNHSFPEP